MNEKSPAATPPTITVADVLHVVFRHKWKIGLISLAGFIAAIVVRLLSPALYESEAKLFIKYVMEARSPASGPNDRPRTDDGVAAIATELDIMTTLDAAKAAITNIGPDRILGKGTVTNAASADLAAAYLQKSVKTEVTKGGKVIRVTFEHPDKNIVQSVLIEFINAYVAKSQEIHRPSAFIEALSKQAEAVGYELKNTEDALRQAKTNAQVLSLEDSKKAYVGKVSKIEEQLLDAAAELAQRSAVVAEIQKAIHVNPVSATNEMTETNETAVSSETLAEYKKVCDVLKNLSDEETKLLAIYSPQSTRIKEQELQIVAYRGKKKELEQENPALLGDKGLEAKGAQDEGSLRLRAELTAEKARLIALKARIKVLNEELEEVRRSGSSLEELESRITDLERKRKLQEANYQAVAVNLEQIKMDDVLQPGHVSNIIAIQQPSPPMRVASQTHKMMAIVFFGAIAFAFGLAFVLEFYIDTSVKRPAEIEKRIAAPLFISIPLINGNGNGHLLGRFKKRRLLQESNEAFQGAPASAEMATENGLVPVSTRAPLPALDSPLSCNLRPFCEVLRDRLIAFFDLKNLTHKPKLVALTSCGEGAGVSTIAAGLAASLSETGEGNVLLVDMNHQNGAAHDFYKGNLACGLEEALTTGSRDQALVRENLYVVSESNNNANLPRILPNRFKHLVPRLKASDYDYIIFDMPPVSQISPTPRLAPFMDTVLLVVEAEKTDRDLVKRATSMLQEAKATVGVVLNKRRTYVPQRLQQEL